MDIETYKNRCLFELFAVRVMATRLDLADTAEVLWNDFKTYLWAQWELYRNGIRDGRISSHTFLTIDWMRKVDLFNLRGK